MPLSSLLLGGTNVSMLSTTPTGEKVTPVTAATSGTLNSRKHQLNAAHGGALNGTDIVEFMGAMSLLIEVEEEVEVEGVFAFTV